ncbi:hypothetical protein PROVRETT_09151 [Providencia rettgeri DSM 1131]|nr:hypothetical protein PROVRETT_09151 [Providencia rettgeri DSM 1131]
MTCVFMYQLVHFNNMKEIKRTAYNLLIYIKYTESVELNFKQVAFCKLKR